MCRFLYCLLVYYYSCDSDGVIARTVLGLSEACYTRDIHNIVEAPSFATKIVVVIMVFYVLMSVRGSTKDDNFSASLFYQLFS